MFLADDFAPVAEFGAARGLPAPNRDGSGAAPARHATLQQIGDRRRCSTGAVLQTQSDDTTGWYRERCIFQDVTGSRSNLFKKAHDLYLMSWADLRLVLAVWRSLAIYKSKKNPLFIFSLYCYPSINNNLIIISLQQWYRNEVSYIIRWLVVPYYIIWSRIFYMYLLRIKTFSIRYFFLCAYFKICSHCSFQPCSQKLSAALSKSLWWTRCTLPAQHQQLTHKLSCWFIRWPKTQHTWENIFPYYLAVTLINRSNFNLCSLLHGFNSLC